MVSKFGDIVQPNCLKKKKKKCISHIVDEQAISESKACKRKQKINQKPEFSIHLSLPQR